MLTLDGSYGEGGGQILRTSLALAAILRRPVRVINIRAKRPKPGLRPQHLTGLLAMAEVCGGRLSGAATGSREIVFEPGHVRPGHYAFDVSRISGSAGSVTLVMQTLLPALCLARGASSVDVIGGTHVAWSPPFHFFRDSFLAAISRMGVEARAKILRWGFYPKGGGKVRLDVNPCDAPKPLELTDRGKLLSIKGLSAVSRLPVSIAERQARMVSECLSDKGPAPEIDMVEVDSNGPGTFIYLRAEFENVTLCFSALGERGKPAEKVGVEAASNLSLFIDTGACVEEHLADQLVPYMAIAKGASVMSVSKITRHLLTNTWVIGQLVQDLRIDVEGEEGGPGRVSVEGRGLQDISG